MASNYTLFVLNSSKELEINKPELLKIKEYEALFKRDKGSKKDLSGNKKLIACGEILYIYLVYDVRSSYYLLPTAIKKEKAKKDADLPDNWKEDEVLNKAITRYLDDFKLSSAGQAYVVAEKAYHSFSSDVSLAQDAITNLSYLLRLKLSKIEASNIGEGELVNIGNEMSAILEKLNNIQKKVLDNIKDFPKLGNTVKELSVKFSEEGGTFKTPVGGGELGNRET